MGVTGLETDIVTGSNTQMLGDQASEGGAESGAYDPDLAKIIAAWPDLSTTTRTKVLDILNAEKQE